MGKCNLIITRKKQFVASLASCNIIIDGIDYGAIKNGSVLQCSLNDGNHEITLKWWQKRKNSAFSFYIPSDVDTVHINVKFSKSTEKFILLSDDVKIENCSCNVSGDNYIVEQNPLHINSTSSTTLNIKQELSDLKWLLDEGIITQEEFDAKKKQLLGL